MTPQPQAGWINRATHTGTLGYAHPSRSVCTPLKPKMHTPTGKGVHRYDSSNEGLLHCIINRTATDECIGAAGVLINASYQTDIYVVTNGCCGNTKRSAEDEAKLRREWFEEEMSIVKPRNWFWLGIEDTKVSDNPDFATQIDFTRYTKVFLPWGKSLHPDHRATYESCLSQIKQQNANKAEYYMYEVCAPFRNPRYYIDITDVLDRKNELIRCHKEMEYEIRQINLLNQFCASQLHEHTDCKCIEAFDKVEIFV